MPVYPSEDISLYYEEKGRGTPVIFLHGFALDRRVWENQIGFFSIRYRTIISDARGHGRSDTPATGYARENRVADILSLLHHLELSKVHLVGHSMGGGDALAFAIDHQEYLLSLTLVGTVAAGWKPSKKFRDFTWVLQEKGIEEVKEQFMESVLVKYKERNSEIKSFLEKIIGDFGGGPWLDPMKGKYPVSDDLSLVDKIKIPVMIMCGKKDLLFRPLAETLAERIPQARLELFRGVGHMVNLEAPDRFNEILSGFLENIN